MENPLQPGFSGQIYKQSYSASGRFVSHIPLDHVDKNTLKRVIYVLHGHGQLAPYFIHKFKSWFTPDNLIIAAEGPNLYYQNGFSGRVVSTWMTKENREVAIQNYLNLLDNTKSTVEHTIGKLPSYCVGFSQGTATVCRWVAKGNNPPDQITLWAGSPAIDLDWQTLAPLFQKKKMIYVCGNSDQFFDNQKRSAIKAHFDSMEIPLHWISFDGDHDIHADALEEVRLFLNF